jgi:hypothetical protein
MLGGSFRLMAKACVPLALLFILAACGSSKQTTSEATIGVRGEGFTVAAPQGWRVSRSAAAVTVRSGSALVSVTRFPLRKPYDESQFEAATKTLDRVAATLARGGGSVVDKAETVTIDNRQARAYTYGGGAKRIAFVLAGRAEYQLFCSSAESDACGLLFSSFTLT